MFMIFIITYINSVINIFLFFNSILFPKKCFGPCSTSVQRIPCRRRAGLVHVQTSSYFRIFFINYILLHCFSVYDHYYYGYCYHYYYYYYYYY